MSINLEFADLSFRVGAGLMREMIARFVEQGGNPVVANSIRQNWNPNWGKDPGTPKPELYEYGMRKKLT